MAPLVVFVDVDDTLVRSVGSKVIPMTSVIEHVRLLKQGGAVLCCWSSGGGEYAREIAQRVGIEDCFENFLPKPNVLLDDQRVADWRRLAQVHPMECGVSSVNDYRQLVFGS